MSTLSFNIKRSPLSTKKKTKQNGQSLVEYALLLSLVGVVVLSILAILGLATTRGLAQVDAALGAKRNSAASVANAYTLGFCLPATCVHVPQCGYDQATHSIELYAAITAGGSGVGGPNVIRAYSEAGSEPVGGNGESPYRVYRVILAGTPPDAASVLCPRTLVVQTDTAHGGLTIETPVLIQDFTAYP